MKESSIIFVLLIIVSCGGGGGGDGSAPTLSAPSPIIKTPAAPIPEPVKEFKKQSVPNPLDAPDNKNEGAPPPNMDNGNTMQVLNNGTIEKEQLTKPNK